MELLDNIADYPNWLKILALGLATLISEDLTTISAGVLASQGAMSFWVATLGCFLGIFLGDGLLYFLGLVVGKPVLRFSAVKRFVSEEQVDNCAKWFERNGLAVVLISRFLPGTRLPTYFAAGILGSRARLFLPAAAIATAIWTPLLVGLSWFFGNQLMGLFESSREYAWIGAILAVGLLFLAVRFGFRFADWKFRRRVKSRLKRLVRYEFWPVGVLYFPIILYNIIMAVRHFRFALPLISNPGIKFSGYVGESKNEIMSAFQGQARFQAKFVSVPVELVVEERRALVERWMEREGVEFPLILKPDIGQRGAGVKKVHNLEDAADYFRRAPTSVHVQEYAPGPYEVGVFYRRYPDQERGEILGLVDKGFPRIVGDGEQDVETLILKHPLAMGRAHIYLERFKDRLLEVLAEGEALQLVQAGNHCLGAIFNDGSHLLTEAMSRRFDEISRAFPGFYIGRYDVRFTDMDRFRKGEGFKIIELNGAGSEPGHMYDAKFSLWRAYGVLFGFYRDLWRIGRANMRRGIKPASLSVLIRAYRGYLRLSKGYPPSE